MIDIRWLLRDNKNFLDFVTILGNFQRDSISRTVFVKSLTQEHWMVLLKRIIYRLLIPWLSYSSLSVSYFTYTLDKRNRYTENDKSAGIYLLEIALFLLTIYELTIEAIQLIKTGRRYFLSYYNYIDILQYFGTLTVLISNISGLHKISMISKREICIFVLLGQGIKLTTDWFRIF